MTAMCRGTTTTSIIGLLNWMKRAELNGNGHSAARPNEYLGTVIPTTDGGYFVCGIAGSSNGDVVGNHGLSDVWVLKLDGSGAFNGKKPSVVQDLSTPMKRYKQPMAVTSFLPIRGQ